MLAIGWTAIPHVGNQLGPVAIGSGAQMRTRLPRLFVLKAQLVTIFKVLG